jgi:hypothetical protein
MLSAGRDRIPQSLVGCSNLLRRECANLRETLNDTTPRPRHNLQFYNCVRNGFQSERIQRAGSAAAKRGNLPPSFGIRYAVLCGETEISACASKDCLRVVPYGQAAHPGNIVYMKS